MEKLNLLKIEDKWEKNWEKKKIFRAKVDKKKKKFFVTTPYPYVSGSLHIGHGRAITEVDIFSRYLRMKGYNVLFPMAFHISGTPVLGISTAIAQGDKDKIALYEGYVSAYIKDKKKVRETVQSFKDPKKIVSFFIPKMQKELSQLGLSVDWERSFNSGDFIHRKLVEWQFKKYLELGLLKKEKYPVLYALDEQNSAGEDDIKDGDIDPVEKTEFTLIKFKVDDSYLVAGTLRPETIFGVTNVWINPNTQYYQVGVGGEKWIISQQGFDKMSYQRKDLQFLGIYTEDLIGRKALNEFTGKEVLILPSQLIDTDIGTGIAMSVPASSPVDYIQLRELQNNAIVRNVPQKEIEDIEIIPVIGTKKFGNKGAVSLVEKEPIALGDKVSLDKLTKELYSEEFHNGIMMDLSGEYAGKKVSEVKDEIKTRLMNGGFAGTMYETSRKAYSRGGGKIIVAVIEDQWFIDFNSEGWKDKALQVLDQMFIYPENMKQRFVDTFQWLDKRPCARKRGLGTRLPFDDKWVIESLSDSTMYMALYPIANIIHGKKLKEKNLSFEFFNYVFLGEGSKNEVAKKSGVKPALLDELREAFLYWMPMDHRHTFDLHLSNHLSFMIFAFGALTPKELWPKAISFHGLVTSEGEKMSKSRGNVITLLNIKEKFGADVFRLYMSGTANIEGSFDWRENEVLNVKNNIIKVYEMISDLIDKKKKGKVSPLFLSKFNRLIRDSEVKIKHMKYREYVGLAFYEMMNLVKEAKLIMSEKDFGAFAHLVCDEWIKLIYPIIPHLAEELWNKLGRKGFVSLESWPVHYESEINDVIEQEHNKLSKVVEDVSNLIKIFNTKGELFEKVYLYTLPKEKTLYSASYISSKVGKEVIVYGVDEKNKHDPQGKASKAKPGRPSIYLE